MAQNGTTRLPEILIKHEADLLTQWSAEMSDSGIGRDDLISEGERRAQCRDFLTLLRECAQQSGMAGADTPNALSAALDVDTSGWRRLRDMLTNLTRSRVAQGFTPSEVAGFVLSCKRSLFDVLRREVGQDAVALLSELDTVTRLLDNLALFTTEVYQAAREEVIIRQQQDMVELSTPVVKLWDGILALPVIGTLDSARTQVVMESLLQRIVETGADIAILDITGVSTVDTLVAQHLLKTVAAARLMGADCIISGIRPQIAQTIVHLGVDLSAVITKATMADAFAVALQRRGLSIRSEGKSSMREGGKE